MSHKIAGCCSICDAPCFEILAVQSAADKHPGEPKRLGPPNDDAMRITFLLFNGRNTDMTFCGGCAESLATESYTLLWRKNLAGWMREQNGDTSKFTSEFENGLLCELGRTTWKELIEHGR